MGIKPRIGWPLILLISFSPLFFWASSIPLNFRFYNLHSAITSLGQAAALVGISMYSLNLFLSGRFKFTEDFFGGMNKVYIAHHILGGVSFILLMLHPLFFAFSYLPASISEALSRLLPGSDWTVNFGIMALLLLMVLLVLTFFVNLPYEFWRLTHKFLGAVLVLGVIHALFVPSDLSRDVFFRNYMLVIFSLGFIPYLYRTVFFRLFIKRINFSISEIDYVSSDVIEIIMTPVKQNLNYSPGQFVFIDFKKSNLPDEVHPFSLTSTPTDGYLSFAAKAEGDFTKKLMKLDINSIVEVEGAYGRFSYLYSLRKSQIWIAGGIGITPFISMAKSLSQYPGFNIDLYYSVKNKEAALYFDKIQKIAGSGVGLRFIPWYSTEKGRLTADVIAQIDNQLYEKDIYICGPPPMMKGLISQLVKLKIKKSHIHSEEFSIND